MPAAMTALTLAVLTLVALLSGCSSQPSARGGDSASSARVTPTARPTSTPGATPRSIATTGPLPGMPRLLNRHDVYAADRPGELSPRVRHDPARIYVPNSQSSSVDVIDPATYRIVDHFAVGTNPQHVTPSYDLRRLYVLNDAGNSVTVIDPSTVRKGRTIAVADPYNMYFTPDGRYAIVVAERLDRLDFRDPHTLRLLHSVPAHCPGVDHADFTADGRYALFSCEFSGQVLRLDITNQRVVGHLHLAGSSPQDVKLAPDGRVFYVADRYRGGVWLISSHRLRVVGFLRTGRDAHGLYVSRDSRYLYVTNRGQGSISVISFAQRRIVRTWHLRGGGSPDMGGVSTDGRVLWLSGRYNDAVYAVSTVTGKLLHKVTVGRSPHGLCVFPQPGRYSLGHTGVFR